ncbi:MAG: nuclear transport factor 2 family protein [Planctomycetota bacterium]|nr:nuclear transport factor 2 family protein [Planctomycetota bacterium]
MSCRTLCFFRMALFTWGITCYSVISLNLAIAQDEPATTEIRDNSSKLAIAFNSAKVDDITAMFMPKGELTDEQGTVHKGHDAIKDLLTKFFAKFPGTQMEIISDSIRLVGPVAIQEGTRFTTAKDGSNASVRFVAILTKTDQGWRIASIRDFADESIPAATPGELLQPLEWLVGDWINEGTDARVKISYKWSEDNNFIVGDILVTKNDQSIMKSTQRIGWDPILGKPRSWIFDSDGGFAEATWTETEAGWVVQSSAVMPDGLTGSASVTITLGENGRYVMSGKNRLIGNSQEPDYEITVVKHPPAVGK